MLEGWLESAVRVSEPGLSAPLTISETVDRSYTMRYMGVSDLEIKLRLPDETSRFSGSWIQMWSRRD